MALTRHLTRFIDWFYVKPVRKCMPKQTFRYLACGGINFVATIFCYYVAFYFIFADRNFDLGFSLFGLRVISPHIASLGISLPVNFTIGFRLQSKISFKRSPLSDHTQLFRYFVTAMAALVITTLFTKAFSYIMPDRPTLAQVIIYCVTAIFSFAAQKHFTFRGAEKE